MTTTFKVVEFYRNNNSINNFNSSSNLNTNNNNNNNNSNNVNNTITLVNANNLNEKKENLLKKSLSNSNSLGLIESPAKNATKTTTTTTTQIQILNNNHIFSSLGFNVIGGYLTEIPATIVDIDFNASNAKLLKIEEGDVILEINGISTRHMTFSEVNKQLRCCGNRIYLKLKSDPEYKSRFSQLLKDEISLKKLLSNNTDSPSKLLQNSLISNALVGHNDNLNNYLSRIASKSYDNNIGSSCTDSPTLFNISHSNTSSNVSSSANSHSNILDTADSTTTTTQIVSKNKQHFSNTSSSLVTLTISDHHNHHHHHQHNKNNKTTQPVNTNNVNGTNGAYTEQIDVDCLGLKTQSDSLSSGAFSSNDTGSSTSSTSSTSANVEHSSFTTSQTDSTPLNGKPLLSANHQNDHAYDNNKLNLNTLVNPELDNLVVEMNSNLDEHQESITTHMNAHSNSGALVLMPMQPVLSFQVEIDDTIKKKIDEKLKECSSGDSDSDSSVNIYTPKAVDLPSAQRLAKRLFYLDGFKTSDVARHLSKKNDFSQLVADEYLKLFNFQSLTLDAALRKFLKQFQLVGDAQEKERVLMYFAKRYVDANNTTFTDVDSCHTLTCAIMLLNTDLHDAKVQNKMTLNEFVENLRGLNNGASFPDVLLESLYSAIKNEPLECASLDNEDSSYDDHGGSSHGNNFSMRPMGTNPFLQMPDPQTAKEFKYGWLLRKCCIDSDGKKVPFLKRSWKMFYASLRDMVLYLHKDDKVFKNNTFDNITNAIRIHHAFASVASDYKKKQFVFRLKTADWSEYLFQTSNSNELFDWVGSINLVAAIFSSPPLPSGIGSTKSFQRPLLPVSKTRYTLQEQYEYHKKHIKQLQSDFSKLESAAGAQNNHITYIKNDEKFFDKDKYTYLQFEIQRYSIYVNKLEENLLQEAALLSQQQAQSPAPLMVNPTFVLNDPLNTNHTYHHQFTPNSTQSPSGPIYFNSNSISNSHNHHHHVVNSSPTHVPILSTNIHELSPSKSMPNTPIHVTSPMKSNMNQPYSNGQSFQVNFNVSPTNGGSKVLLSNNSSSSSSSNSNNDSSMPMTNVMSPKSIKFNNYVD